MIGSTDDLRGRKVTIDPAHVSRPADIGKVFTIGEGSESGGKVFVSLVGPRGLLKYRGLVQWFDTETLDPAPAKPGPRPRAVLTEKQEQHMNPEAKLIAAATKIAAEEQIDLASATKRAAFQLRDEAQAWREQIAVRDASASPPASGVALLRAEAARLRRQRPGITPEVAVELALRTAFGDGSSAAVDLAQPSPAEQELILLSQHIAATEQIDLAQATKTAAARRPDLASAR